MANGIRQGGNGTMGNENHLALKETGFRLRCPCGEDIVFLDIQLDERWRDITQYLLKMKRLRPKIHDGKAFAAPSEANKTLLRPSVPLQGLFPEMSEQERIWYVSTHC